LNFKSLLIAGNMAFLVDAFMILLSKKKRGLRDEM